MFLDKYVIKTFNDFTLNKNIIPKINKYFENGIIFNTIFYGPKDNGKYTTVKCLLESIYGKEIYNLKQANMKINVNGVTKEIKTFSSNYHYEIYLNNYLFNDRISLSILIRNIAENININNLTYNIIVIKNCQYLTKENILVIKNVSEKYYNNIRFLLTGSNISKLNNILSNFFYIRIPRDIQDKRLKYFKAICNENNINITHDKLNCLIDENGLKSSLVKLEYLFLDKKAKNTDVDIYFKNIINIITGKSNFDIDKLRENMYNITTRNIDKSLIFSRINEMLFKLNIDDAMKLKTVSLISKYECRNKLCYKDIIHLEGLIINLTYLFHNINI